MKKMLLILAMAVQAAAFAAAEGASAAKLSLTDARSRIDAVVEGKESIAAVIKQLSAADQTAFLGEVNKAVNEMPASMEEKTAKQLNLNQAAIRAVKGTGNVKAMLAETFATASPEALTVLNERFAVDLLNRAADPKVTYTDEQFTEIAKSLMEAVNERVESTDNGSARSAFAALTLVRASNGTPENLADTLIDTMKHDDAKELAASEWIPSALGKNGSEKGYESLLAASNAGRRPDFNFVLTISGPQYIDAVLGDISGKNTDQISFIQTRSPILDAVVNPLVHQVPALGNDAIDNDIVIPPEEPGPYPGQH